MINRSVVLVIPKKPFFDWEKYVFPDQPSIEENLDEYSSYLLSDGILPFEPQKALKPYWKDIFENELFDICIDESTWPQKRTWKLFTEWFDLKFSTVVHDLEGGPIRDDDEFEIQQP